MKAVHHVGITVPDLERGDRVLQRRPRPRVRRPAEPGLRRPRARPGGRRPGRQPAPGEPRLRRDDRRAARIHRAAAAATRRPVPANATGAAHLAFHVENVEAKKAELEAAGVEFLSEVNVVDEGVLAGWRWVYFRDPFGILLELVEVAYSATRRRPPQTAETRDRSAPNVTEVRDQGATGRELDAEEARELYRRMRLIRGFEDAVQSQFQKGNVHGTTHLYSGQEASGVGVGSMLRRGRQGGRHLPRPRPRAGDRRLGRRA